MTDPKPITLERAERLLEIANARTETPYWQRIEDAQFDYNGLVEDYRIVCSWLIQTCQERDHALAQEALRRGNFDIIAPLDTSATPTYTTINTGNTSRIYYHPDEVPHV